jgi:hypothetical protein
MAVTVSTPIEEKKKKLNKDAGSAMGTNNWAGFGLSLISNLILTLIIGLLGSNFIYLTRSASTMMNKTSSVLEYLMPTKEGAYFPDENVREKYSDYLKTLTNKTFVQNCGKNNDCFKAEPCTNYQRLAKVNIGTLGGWPYSMKDPKVPDPSGLWQKFKYWVADSVAKSYIRDRSWMQKWLTFFAPEKEGGNMFANQSLQMYIIAPLMYLLVPLVMCIVFLSLLFSMIGTSPGWAICGFFLCYTFFILYGVASIQMFQYMCTLLFVPLLADAKMVKNIFKCNGKSLMYFFLFLTCASAFANFDNTIAITVLVMYIIILITGYW